MRLDCPSCHVELTGNLGVVTALQEQFDDLLLAWSQPNCLFLHSLHPPNNFSAPKPGAENGPNNWFAYSTAPTMPF
jgi:hypothetical protein